MTKQKTEKKISRGNRKQRKEAIDIILQKEQVIVEFKKEIRVPFDKRPFKNYRENYSKRPGAQ